MLDKTIKELISRDIETLIDDAKEQINKNKNGIGENTFFDYLIDSNTKRELLKETEGDSNKEKENKENPVKNEFDFGEISKNGDELKQKV